MFTSTKGPGVTVDSPGLGVVARSFDDTEAASAALTRASEFRAAETAVLRHHLILPQDRVAEAAAVVAQDGYALREIGPHQGDQVLAHALRAELVTALGCARERSRMAGLAQRLGGDALGWDVLQTGGRETDNINPPDRP
ncbi:hypothetical protein V5P93_006120 [Actinokineospora auranticolor]|nr:hypothetical protein [Actinokineospora auranticolor]